MIAAESPMARQNGETCQATDYDGDRALALMGKI